jgi:hypothetical protein
MRAEGREVRSGTMAVAATNERRDRSPGVKQGELRVGIGWAKKLVTLSALLATGCCGRFLDRAVIPTVNAGIMLQTSTERLEDVVKVELAVRGVIVGGEIGEAYCRQHYVDAAQGCNKLRWIMQRLHDEQRMVIKHRQDVFKEMMTIARSSAQLSATAAAMCTNDTLKDPDAGATIRRHAVAMSLASDRIELHADAIEQTRTGKVLKLAEDIRTILAEFREAVGSDDSATYRISQKALERIKGQVAVVGAKGIREMATSNTEGEAATMAVGQKAVEERIPAAARAVGEGAKVHAVLEGAAEAVK